MRKSVLAWHFTKGNKLRDGRPVPPIGEWLIHTGDVSMCRSGLHASIRLFDSIGFAPGGTLHRVECEDVIQKDSDKLVCRRRRILATMNESRADQMFRRFARIAAYTVLDKWDAPKVVRRWLETGDESIRAAARAAAGAAAGDVAWAAARAAAGAAAYGAYNDQCERLILADMGLLRAGR